MGLFNRTKQNNGNTNRTQNEQNAHAFVTAQPAQIPTVIPGNVAIFKPRSYNQILEIVEHLRTSGSVIVYMDEIRESTAQRCSDILIGAIYALGGSMYEIQPRVYLYSTGGVEERYNKEQ